jgi:transcription termination factor Rho
MTDQNDPILPEESGTASPAPTIRRRTTRSSQKSPAKPARPRRKAAAAEAVPEAAPEPAPAPDPAPAPERPAPEETPELPFSSPEAPPAEKPETDPVESPDPEAATPVSQAEPARGREPRREFGDRPYSKQGGHRGRDARRGRGPKGPRPSHYPSEQPSPFSPEPATGAPAGPSAAPAQETPADGVRTAQEPPQPTRQPDPKPLPPPEPPREPEYAEGLVEVSGKGFGFLRDPKRGYTQSPQDIFVTPDVVRKHSLRDGQWVRGEIRRGNRGVQLYKLVAIEGEDPERFRYLPLFEELTVLNPDKRIRLETVPDRFTTRVIDMMAPIGKGQRGLIVAPPRTGKTTLLEHIADAVAINHPEVKLIILLVDERPEEVTEIKRACPGAEIMASSNDSDVKSHTRIALLAMERAKRLVEAGKDVFVLLDSLTRVGRAFNNAVTGSGGRTLSGGMDARALEIPRKLFAAARNTEGGGSLTIVATALIETGSRMDELIFQEFKGTGNMELVLNRTIADQRVYPAVDIFLSGTRREELLLDDAELHKISLIRRGLSGHKPIEAIDRLLSFLRKFSTNRQMLSEIPG